MDNKRFDACYHLSDGVAYRRTITHTPYPILSFADVTSRVFYGVRANRIYVTNREHALPFLTGAAIMQSDLTKTKLVSRKYTPAIKEMTLKAGWVLVTRSGTIGQTAWSNKLYEGKYGSEDIIRLVPNGKMKGGVLYSYLASVYGQTLLTQGSFGAVIQHIEPSFISLLPIPDFPQAFQKEVDDLIQESARLREEAIGALENAKDILASWISAEYEKHYFQSSSVSSKDIWNSLQHRLDPPALMNDGVKTMNGVKNRMEHTTIGKIKGKVYRPGIFKRIYVETGIPYIKGSEIFLSNPFRRCDKLSRTRTPFIDEMAMKEGQILITCAGSVGDIKLITKEYEDKESIGSQDIIRLESNDDLYTKEYLFVYLQQPFVYDYIQSMKYGAVIERIEPFHVESIPVVKPTKELSNEITEIIRKYMDCTYRAFNAEERAISMVEQEIEKWN
jgi:hypothetical protein